MRRLAFRSIVLILTLLAALTAPSPATAQPPTPESFIGHPVGADRKLAPYPRVLEYLRTVAAASDRVSVETAGTSTLDHEMVTVVLTSAANQAELDRYREIARRLANPDSLTSTEASSLADEGKAIALVTCSIHATEVGCTQMAMEFAYDFATTQDPRRLAWMDDVILILMPSINPDGQHLVIDWYNEYLGTPYEGGRLPWLYHHYVGHDNNRDFYMLTQAETRVVNDVLYHRWFPQVFVDEHQMGSTGPRMFVPPQTDPLAPEVSSLVFRQADVIGTNMSYRLEEGGKTGVGHNMMFDSYWPGGTRNTAWWKNVTGLLTEVASARIATPIYIEPGELRGGAKGFPEYSRRANFPSPWPGGWWRLRDIVDYELIATWALVESCSQYRHELLTNFYRMGADEVAAGSAGAPYGWVIPPDQHDPVAAGKLVELLLRHGVRVTASEEELHLGRTVLPAGTQVIPAAQPYRAFLLTMLRPQRYPEVRPYEGGPIYPPYDVTSWSLPLHMGVEVLEADLPIGGSVAPIDHPVWPSSAVPAGDNGYLISHSHDTAFTAMNRLLEQGRRIYWLLADEGNGRRGDIYLPSGSVSASELASLADELHLPIAEADATPMSPRLEVSRPRIGLYQPWTASMDEGWTRFVLEQYEFDYQSLHNDAIQGGELDDSIDALLLPDMSKEVIEKGNGDNPRGRRDGEMPPAYAGGLGSEGGDNIREWVRAGGTLVALDSASGYAIDLFELPVEDALEDLGRDEFSAPGTTLRILVDTAHPLGFGMRAEEAAYFAGSPAFRTFVPDPRFGRHVIAHYPDHRDDIPLSGYVNGVDHLRRLAAAVDFTVGDGHVILIGFRAQHRAQPLRTFKLLFNALYYPKLVEVQP